MSPEKNNLLIIMADQLTAKALGCYGNRDVVSPQIDALAETGVLFSQAYSSSPLCTPGRYAFMTGQHVSVCGGYDNAAYMPATMPTLAHYLRLMGYRTTLAGKMHFVGADQLHGFEERLTTDIYPADFGWVPDWENPDDRIDLWYHNMSSVKQAGIAAITNQLTYDDEVGATTVRAIYDHSRSEDERPFCLVSSFIHPHDPYATRQKYWDLYADRDISPPTVQRRTAAETDSHNKRLEKVIALDAVDVSTDEIIAARRAYYGNVSYVDEWVGRIRSTLEECDLARNTTIVFLSDHGDMLGEHGLW
nr:choline-sulfatase [Granulosicoccus sp.]